MSVETPETVRDKLLFDSFAVCYDRFNHTSIRTNLGYGYLLGSEELPKRFPALVIDLRLMQVTRGLDFGRVVSTALTIYDDRRDAQSIVVQKHADPKLFNNPFAAMFVDTLRAYRSNQAAALLVAQVAEPLAKPVPIALTEQHPLNLTGAPAWDERHPEIAGIAALTDGLSPEL